MYSSHDGSSVSSYVYHHSMQQQMILQVMSPRKWRRRLSLHGSEEMQAIRTLLSPKMDARIRKWMGVAYTCG